MASSSSFPTPSTKEPGEAMEGVLDRARSIAETRGERRITPDHVAERWPTPHDVHIAAPRPGRGPWTKRRRSWSYWRPRGRTTVSRSGPRAAPRSRQLGPPEETRR
jgi:hypothetical protein